MAVIQLNKHKDTLLRDNKALKESYNAEVEALKKDLKEAKVAMTRVKDLLKSQDALTTSYKAESEAKDSSIKNLEVRLTTADSALKMKDDLIDTFSTRAADAEEMDRFACNKISLSADLIFQMTVSSVDDLVAFVKLEELLGLSPLSEEMNEHLPFYVSVANRMPKVLEAVNLFIDERVELEGKQSLVFTEGFARCLYQLSHVVAMETVNPQEVEDPTDEALFERVIERKWFGTNFPYDDMFESVLPKAPAIGA